MADKENKIDVNSIYIPSENIVSREIEDTIIIIPLSSGVGDMEDELYTLNETGKAIWKWLDGNKTVKALSQELATSFEATVETIEEDVTGLLQELLNRKMVIKKT